MKFRSIIPLLCLAAFMTLLCACHNPSDPSEETTLNETETTNETVFPEDSVRLSENGKCRFEILMPEQADQAQKDAALKVRDTLVTVTGDNNIGIGGDALGFDQEYDPESYQILIGDTACPQTADLKQQLAWNAYGIAWIDHKIVLSSHSLSGLNRAVTDFNSMLTAAARAGDGKNLTLSFPSRSIIHTVPGMRYDIPDYIGGQLLGAFDCSDSEASFIVEYTSGQEFDAYISRLLQNGFTETNRNQIAHNTHITLQKGSDCTVYAYFFPSARRATVLVGKNIVASMDMTAETVCTPLLTQLRCGAVTGAMGMGYLFRLPDSSFLMIDGGLDSDREAEELLELLQAQNCRSDGKLVIRAWIITHSHNDHYNVLRTFAARYASQMELEHLIFNPMSEEYQKYCDTPNAWDARNALSAFSGCTYVKAHTGQVFRLPGCEMEILYTAEDVFTNPFHVDAMNDTSIVCRLTIAGQTTLITGDIGAIPAELLCKTYGDYLKSDIVQIAHHGYYGASEAFYELVRPEVALWPISAGKVESWGSKIAINRYWLAMDSLKETIVGGNGTCTLTLPYIPE